MRTAYINLVEKHEDKRSFVRPSNIRDENNELFLEQKRCDGGIRIQWSRILSTIGLL
jgi:hypothetical protein